MTDRAPIHYHDMSDWRGCAGNPENAVEKTVSEDASEPVPLKALPRNSDGTIAQLDFSSDNTKIRGL